MNEALLQKRKNHWEFIYKKLQKIIPEKPHAFLDHETPWQLAVAVILSAQCTDERINKVTPELFRRAPDAAATANLSLEDLTELLSSVSFFNNKSKNIYKTSQLVSQMPDGLPKTMKGLVALPGIGAKTANVILGQAWDIPSGVVVDTHVKRFATRFGLTKESSPIKIEEDLKKIIKKKDWIDSVFYIILYRRTFAPTRGYDPLKDPLFGNDDISHGNN